MGDLSTSRQAAASRIDIGDAAVDGLLNGLVGGLAMALTLVIGGLLTGDAPGAVMARFDPYTGSAVQGTLLHLAVSSVYGLIFTIGWRMLSRWLRAERFGWLAGLVYGVALLALARLALLPGADSTLRQVPLVHFAAAHMVYGLTVGLLAKQKQAE
jgi:hypothetical protein